MDQQILAQRARAFEYLFDAVVVTDMQGIITDWNPGSEKLYGYMRDEAIGQPVSILHVPEDSERVTAEVLRSVSKEGKWTGEIRMLHKDGHTGWIESIVVPLLDDQGDMSGVLGINRDISARVNHEERLARLAHYDQLTEIPNRYLLMERVQQHIAYARRANKRFGVVFVDLNDFKNVNDTYGHAAGDAVLREVARRFRKAIRASDTVARMGGDEFVVLLDDVGQQQEVNAVIEHIVQALAQPMNVYEKSISVSASMGMALYPVDGVTTDELLKSADAAMYQIKRFNHEVATE